MRGRTAFAVLAAALVLPAAAAGADTFVIVSEPQAPEATQVLPTVPSALEANQPGQIAVDADFGTHPAWVEQRSLDDLRNLWERAGNAYGIPWQVLAAINKVESNFGSNMGPSSAGAVGWMQFMPDTWLSWGMDADGDGVADPWNADDAISRSTGASRPGPDGCFPTTVSSTWWRMSATKSPSTSRAATSR